MELKYSGPGSEKETDYGYERDAVSQGQNPLKMVNGVRSWVFGFALPIERKESRQACKKKHENLIRKMHSMKDAP